MKRDWKILRGLAYQYADVMRGERNARAKQLHIASNDLHMLRPVVRIEELPWGQLNVDGALDCECEDEDLRGAEAQLRELLLRARYFSVDHIMPEFVRVWKREHWHDDGMRIADHSLAGETGTSVASHEYADQLEDEAALENVHTPRLSYDREETMRVFAKLGEALGDILPVKLTSADQWYCAPWDVIARFRGVTPLLMDLYDRPEYSHRIARHFYEREKAVMAQREALGLLDGHMDAVNQTPALTNDLPVPEAGETVTRKNMWLRGTAQIFGSVSPEMHEAFDIQYISELAKDCGLVYYGCCEPLDTKIDIVAKIPNLRKIGCSPWANVDSLTEQVGGRYVVAFKPNPALLATPTLHEEEARKNIQQALEAAKRNGVRGMDIVMKDISTVAHNPQNLFRWAEIAMELVESW
ncbi:MAG: hypothetical protein LBC83_04695 [Oscillospiraceae bacterium]|jgi:hypothetical protein|nr:hypothetical protein [Oscillospiraceae bacterium]